jgi:SAM-dependent methyltransferase
MEELDTLYEKWLTEKNRGHYKDHISQKQNIHSLIGTQNSILNELEERFLSYGIKFQGSLLDVGCSYGGGLYTYYNSGKFDFVAGVDIDKTAIDMATRYKKINKISDEKLFVDVAEIYNLPFEDNKFDFIVMKDVGEHLGSSENLQRALSELKRVLKEDGFIYIETPNYLFPFEAHLEIFMLPYFATKQNTKFIAKIRGKNPDFIDHLNFTTPMMFSKIFEIVGFDFKDVYLEKKLPYIIKNTQKLSDRFKFAAGLLKFIRKLGFDRFLIWIFKTTKMYPTLQYIISPKKRL